MKLTPARTAALAALTHPGRVSRNRPGRKKGARRPPPGDGAVRAERVIAYREEVRAVYRAYAIDQGCAEVEKIETDTVTPAMLRIEAEDPDRCLVGFENRLKGKDRLAEKVPKAVEEQPDLSYDDALAWSRTLSAIHSVPDERTRQECRRISSGSRKGDSSLWTAGTRGKGSYKGINSRWRVPENRPGLRGAVPHRGQLPGEAGDARRRTRSATRPRRKTRQERLEEYQRR